MAIFTLGVSMAPMGFSRKLVKLNFRECCHNWEFVRELGMRKKMLQQIQRQQQQLYICREMLLHQLQQRCSNEQRDLHQHLYQQQHQHLQQQHPPPPHQQQQQLVQHFHNRKIFYGRTQRIHDTTNTNNNNNHNNNNNNKSNSNNNNINSSNQKRKIKKCKLTIAKQIRQMSTLQFHGQRSISQEKLSKSSKENKHRTLFKFISDNINNDLYITNNGKSVFKLYTDLLGPSPTESVSNGNIETNSCDVDNCNNDYNNNINKNNIRNSNNNIRNSNNNIRNSNNNINNSNNNINSNNNNINNSNNINNINNINNNNDNNNINNNNNIINKDDDVIISNNQATINAKKFFTNSFETSLWESYDNDDDKRDDDNDDYNNNNINNSINNNNINNISIIVAKQHQKTELNFSANFSKNYNNSNKNGNNNNNNNDNDNNNNNNSYSSSPNQPQYQPHDEFVLHSTFCYPLHSTLLSQIDENEDCAEVDDRNHHHQSHRPQNYHHHNHQQQQQKQQQRHQRSSDSNTLLEAKSNYPNRSEESSINTYLVTPLKTSNSINQQQTKTDTNNNEWSNYTNTDTNNNECSNYTDIDTNIESNECVKSISHRNSANQSSHKNRHISKYIPCFFSIRKMARKS
ncbi:hypothetical protein HELRODRAFT_191167 [Helobdella robusta]|uniref:Uncharacterized protein n=1 Tax=Helobdella robusta TaxID=6412 RepID=T1FSP4_HELRO|nr:hypothetical protein HELRODRAFT_191167 [Helobdella robusta]ESO07394.1 hypothetical protein HELRODRAFT_191167 [Helobdella robusta]